MSLFDLGLACSEIKFSLAAYSIEDLAFFVLPMADYTFNEAKLVSNSSILVM